MFSRSTTELNNHLKVASLNGAQSWAHKLPPTTLMDMWSIQQFQPVPQFEFGTDPSMVTRLQNIIQEISTPMDHDARPFNNDSLSLQLSSIKNEKKTWGKARVEEFDTPISKRHEHSTLTSCPSLKVQAKLIGRKKVHTSKTLKRVIRTRLSLMTIILLKGW